MPLKNYFIKNKNLANVLFVSTLIPYLLLCLTLGGFHTNLFNTRECHHGQHFAAHETINTSHIKTSEDVYQHNSETCQICQWLKTPSTAVQFLSLDTQCECVHINFVYYSNPPLSSLPIHNFTIRPPPTFSCLPI
jgi:hypothetical protein